MRQVLKGQKNRIEQERVSCSDLAWEFKEAACRLGEVQGIPVFLETEEGEHKGEILCSRTELLRAWKNIVSNGLEHTSPEKGIRIEICEKVLEDPYSCSFCKRLWTGVFKGGADSWNRGFFQWG